MSTAAYQLEAGVAVAAGADRRPGASVRPVRLLEVDPDLGAGIAPENRSATVSRAVAAGLAFKCGPWQFRPRDEGGLGALILEGMILVRVEFAGMRANLELLGEGDVISPWQGMGLHPTAPCAVTARVISNLEIALLDRGFMQRATGWPEIHSALMRRLLGRARMLSMQSAINSLPRIEERLEITLWQLAYRFGHVTPDGIRLQLPLSHSQLFPTSTGNLLTRKALSRRITKHAAHGAERCPSLTVKTITPHTLRHTAAMRLLHAGVDTTVIALWLGHEQVETTQMYLHADLAIKERALARTKPLDSKPGRYRPPDALLGFLDGL